MGVVSGLLAGVALPKMMKVRQCFDDTCISPEQIPERIRDEIARIEENNGSIQPGMQIAITAGSRGISNIAVILRAIAEEVKSRGAIPFIVPAMGSHGGATAEGQREVLEAYGITEETVGCEIRSSMETVVVGYTTGEWYQKAQRENETDSKERNASEYQNRPVYIDKNAAEADGIIVCGRIKPHTGYRGPYESGLMKMLAIGLGKQKGAEAIHADGFGEMYHLIPEYGTVILKNAPILFGLAILENAYDRTRELIALTPQEIISEETGLLARAKSYMPRILFDCCDVLVVDRIGKNISGDGMDPNISGRFPTPYAQGGIDAQRVVVLDLTDETHGNACGIGLADCTTKRLFDRMDLEATYPNAITNTVVGELKIPMMMENDKLAIQLGIKTCNKIDREQPRVIHIKDTLSMQEIEVSEVYREEVLAHPNLELTADAEPWAFDANGNLDK